VENHLKAQAGVLHLLEVHPLHKAHGDLLHLVEPQPHGVHLHHRVLNGDLNLNLFTILPVHSALHLVDKIKLLQVGITQTGRKMIVQIKTSRLLLYVIFFKSSNRAHLITKYTLIYNNLATVTRQSVQSMGYAGKLQVRRPVSISTYSMFIFILVALHLIKKTFACLHRCGFVDIGWPWW